MASKVRKRRPHLKTRNGCQTCKNRHIKCDQSWPSCNRCTGTGRECDGYDKPLSQFIPRHMSVKHFRESFYPSPAPSPLRRFGTRSTEEMRSIHWFQNRTIPTLSGYFDTDIWDLLPLSIGHIEPAAFHAVIALSAYHEMSQSIRPTEYWDIHHDATSDAALRFASEQYSAAISSFRSNLSSNRLSSHEVEMLCILFASVEFLRGDPDSALVHISGALGFVKSCQQNSLLSKEEAALKSLLARMSLTQSFYGRPRGAQLPDLLTIHKETLKSQEEKFSSLSEARMELTYLLNSTIPFINMTQRTFPDHFSALTARRWLERQLENWSLSFEAFVRGSSLVLKDQRGLHLLRCHHLMATIFIAVAEAREESAFDFQICNFEAIITSMECTLADELSGQNSFSPSFSLDLGIIPCLFYAAIKCRFPNMRRRAIALLHYAPRQEGVWDAIECAKAAELAMDFEERHLSECSLTSNCPIPEWARVHHVDIQRRDPLDPSKQLVILSWNPEGINDGMQKVHTYIHW